MRSLFRPLTPTCPKSTPPLAVAWGAACLLLGAGCARVDPGAFSPGQTTETELRTRLGAPLSEHAPAAAPETQVLEYPDQLLFVLEAGRLQGIQRAPRPPESALQYWRQKWRGKIQYSSAAPGGLTESHPGATPVRQLSCPEARASVTYEERSGRVLRVSEYAH